MHVRDSQRDRRPRSGALTLLGLVVLLAVVALASSGHVSLGTNSTRRPGHELADTFVSLLVVFMLLGGIGVLYVYYLQRSNSHEERRKGLVKGHRRALMFFLAISLLLILIVRAASHSRNHQPGGGLTISLPLPERGDKAGGYTPHFTPYPVAAVLGAAGIAALAAYLSHRARQKALRPPALGPALGLTLADVLRETLDDLRAEPDPRIAVIAAYARLERTFAAFGMPRRESDAPLEYLRRILVEFDVGAGRASRLTQLFEQAKFSTRDVGPEMKAEAIELLEAIRADLQAADAARAAASAPPPLAGQPA